MKIVVVWVGKTRNLSLDSLIGDYRKRISYFCELVIREVRPAKVSHEPRMLVVEQQGLLRTIKPTDFLILLDQDGRSLTSERFAALIQKRLEQPVRALVFIVGGHAGVSEAVKERADFTLSLSQMTVTHEMARCLLLEQIYRAFTILNHLPYHK